MKKLSICLFAIGSIVLSCKEDPKEESPDYAGQRAATIEHISSQIIVPQYDLLKTDLKELHDTFENFMQDSAGTNVLALRNALLDTYVQWQYVSTFEFGPAAEVALRNAFNTYPCDTSKINRAISEGNTQFDQLGMSDAIGLPTLDYLFFEKSTAELQDAYFNHGLASQREHYTHELIDFLIDKLDHVILDWSAQGENYLSTFQNSSGTDVGSALGILVNSYNQHFERYFRDGKLGIPLGIRSLGIALPDKVESLFAQRSLILLNEHLTAMENLYLGRNENNNGDGLDDYLIAIGASDLHQSISNQFSMLHSCLSNVEDPLEVRVIDRKSDLEGCYEEMQKMVILLKVDMPSRMGILITYQDNDGD